MRNDLLGNASHTGGGDSQIAGPIVFRRRVRSGLRSLGRVMFAAALPGALAAGLPAICLPQIAAAAAQADAGGKPITFPYRLGFAMGGQWMVYPGGMLQQQNGMPLFGQNGAFTLNNNQPTQTSNQGRIDSDGEIVVEGLQFQGINASRRIFFDGNAGYWRIIDVLKSTQGQDVSVQYGLQSQVNYGIRSTSPINGMGPRDGDLQVGVAVQEAQGRNFSMIFCGHGGKVTPTINADQNNNSISATMNVTIPANGEIAIMHFVVNAADPSKLVKEFSGPKAVANVPRRIKHELINFASNQGLGEGVYGSALEDVDLLHGDLFDIIELRDGDQYKGTLTLASYSLETAYGTVTLPAAEVWGMLNIGQARPRQCVVTRDGQVFCGHLQTDHLPLTLSGGQPTQVPLAQVQRVGYRARPGDDAAGEIIYTKPMLYLRAGDRLAVSLTDQTIPVATRYGPLELKPQSLAALILANPDQPVHEIVLADGSRFAGLLTSADLDVNVLGAASPPGALGAASPGGEAGASTNPSSDSLSSPMAIAHAKFPWSQVARLEINRKPQEPDPGAPTLRLSNGDVLVGVFLGTIKLDTPFDTLTLSGQQIKAMSPMPNSTTDVRVKLWDDTSVSGTLEASELDFKMNCGVQIKAPLSLLTEYLQPYPQPSPEILQRVRDVVANLNANDWKVRDRAQAELIQMGPAVVPVLRQLRDSQPPEAKQRIDIVISSLKSSQGASASPPPAQPSAEEADFQMNMRGQR